MSAQDVKCFAVIIKKRLACCVRFHSPPILAFWRASVGPPVLNGSPEGGFITLVWSAESELVLRGERHRQRVKGGEREEQRLGGGEG